MTKQKVSNPMAIAIATMMLWRLMVMNCVSRSAIWDWPFCATAGWMDWKVTEAPSFFRVAQDVFAYLLTFNL
jgi:hypothetical protein